MNSIDMPNPEVTGGAISLVDTENCTISDNLISNNLMPDGKGAGIYLGPGAQANVFNNDMINNQAMGGQSDGGGLYTESQGGYIYNNRFVRNMAGRNGGGIYLKGSTPPVNGTSFVQNAAIGNGGGAYLDAVDETGGFTNCVFHRNRAITNGGGIQISAGAPRFIHHSLTQHQAGNVALLMIPEDPSYFGGGVSFADGSPTMINNVFSLNIPLQIKESPSSTQSPYLESNFFDSTSPFYYSDPQSTILDLAAINAMGLSN